MREEKTKYYVIKEKAVPEVLLKVIEAKRLMDMQELTVQQATEKAGISRSSFYKYKDDILPFHDNAKGKTITFILQMDDEPGLLSDVLKIIAEFHGNSDHSSDDSVKRRGVTDDQRGYRGRPGRRLGDDQRD